MGGAVWHTAKQISPYISEGSGLKHFEAPMGLSFHAISPYISEGSGLKQIQIRTRKCSEANLPLHQ